MDRHLALDTAAFVVDDPPLPGVPRIAVVVSLWFPGLEGETYDLMTQLTVGGFDAVRAAGGFPVLVDSSADHPADASAVIENCDGVMFLGGADLDPALYGVVGPVPNSYGVHRPSDLFGIALVRAALAADRPILAICRGAQLVNVASGGTLIPDIADYARHRGGPGRERFVGETVSLVDGSRIRGLLGRDRVDVLSAHHQAVNRLGDGLVVSAVAEDGIVEAFEHLEKRWVVALQWHPEHVDADHADRSRIVGALVAASTTSRQDKRLQREAGQDN